LDKNYQVLALFICCSLWANAQFGLGFQESVSNDMSFEIDGTTFEMSTAGGLNTPQFSEIDLDGDGTLDLFVFDRWADVIRTFKYNVSKARYEYAPEYERQFPSMHELVLLRDYNCDGFEDIFTYNQGAYTVYRNTGQYPLVFEKVVDKIQSDYGSITTSAFILSGDVPAIVDVDNDGDLDILAFGTVATENTIEYHRNLSQDLYNSCDSLEFEVATQCWGNVMEPSNSAALEPVTCKGIVPPNRDNQHPGSSVLLIDTDNDGDKDLIVGDIQTDVVVHAVNAGDAQTAAIDVSQQTNDYPTLAEKIKIPYQVSGYQIDVDHDGHQDLLMTINNNVDSSANRKHVWYYENTSSTAPNFELNKSNFLVGDMLDLGSGIDMERMDVNGDGDMDLLIVNDFKASPTGSSLSQLHYFENDGSNHYELIDDNFGSFSTFSFQGAKIALGDLDGDADLDLLVGDAQGYLHWFKNTPSAGMASFALSAPQYMSIADIGANAAPEIADINNDGLLDILVGERTGKLHYYQNTGTATAAQFSSSADQFSLGGIDVTIDCCNGNSAPHFVKTSAFGPGEYLFVGTDEKKIYIYEVGDDVTQEFPLVDSISLESGRICPLTGDFDNDGVWELLIGTAEGGVKYYDRDKNYLVSVDEPSTGAGALTLFPNPTSGVVSISGNTHLIENISVADLSGRLLFNLTSGDVGSGIIDLNDLENGVYFIVIDYDKKQQTTTVVLSR